MSSSDKDYRLRTVIPSAAFFCKIFLKISVTNFQYRSLIDEADNYWNSDAVKNDIYQGDAPQEYFRIARGGNVEKFHF